MRNTLWQIARMIFISALLVVLAPLSLPRTRSVAEHTVGRERAPAQALTTALAEIDDDDDGDDDVSLGEESSFHYAHQDRTATAVVLRLLNNAIPRVPFRLAAFPGRAPPVA